MWWEWCGERKGIGATIGVAREGGVNGNGGMGEWDMGRKGSRKRMEEEEKG